MKALFFILSLLILASVSSGQISGGWGWNYERRTLTANESDSMTWANAALTLYYQVHPQTTDQDTLPLKSSRFWAGKGAANKRTRLLAIATTQLDSTVRYVPIKSDSLLFGRWMRFIVTDATNTDTSEAIRISGYDKFMVYYYFDDVSTNLLRQYLKVETLK